MPKSKQTDTKKRRPKSHLLAGTDDEVTAPAQTTQSNVEIETSCKPGKDLAEASASHTEPYNKPREMRSKDVKGKSQEQQQLTETTSNAASSQEHQDAATANAADAQIRVEKVSSKSKRSKARKKAKQKEQQLHDSQQQQQQQSPCSPSTGTAPNVERAEILSQESIPTADAEITLEQISANLGQLESIIELVRKQLSKVFGPLPPSATKLLKKQRSLVQVRGEHEAIRAANRSESTRNAESEHPRESSQRQPQ